MNRAVPTQAARGVRVTATEGGIPGAGNLVVSVVPTHGPAVDGGSAIVSNADGALKAGIPLIVKRIRADRSVRLARDDHAQA